MALELRALIAAKDRLERLAGRFKSARVVELAEGLGLLPLTAELEREAGGAASGPFAGLRLGAALAAAAVELSKSGPVAFVEAAYGDGRDFQASVLWQNGRVTAGPLKADTVWDPRDEDLCERPVNAALRALGISADGPGDEWDAVGLARHRRTEDWAR